MARRKSFECKGQRAAKNSGGECYQVWGRRLHGISDCVSCAWICPWIAIDGEGLKFNFSLVPFYLGVASSYGMFYRFWNSRAVVYLLMALLIVVNLPMVAGYYSGYTKDDWRGFSGQISNLTQPGDRVVLLPGYISQPFNYYYSNATDRTFEFSAYTVQDLQTLSAQRGNSTI